MIERGEGNESLAPFFFDELIFIGVMTEVGKCPPTPMC